MKAVAENCMAQAEGSEGEVPARAGLVDRSIRRRDKEVLGLVNMSGHGHWEEQGRLWTTL